MSRPIANAPTANAPTAIAPTANAPAACVPILAQILVGARITSFAIGYSERLEQLDWVAGWILDKNLFAAVSGHDRIAESRSLTFQFLDRGFQILHHNLDSVPTTWSRNLFIFHRFVSTSSTGPIQQQL